MCRHIHCVKVKIFFPERKSEIIVSHFIHLCQIYETYMVVFPLNYSECRYVLSCVWLFATPWSVTCQAPLSMGFSRQEYWSGLPFPPPGELPDPRIEPRSPALQVDSLPLSLWGSPMYICAFYIEGVRIFSSLRNPLRSNGTRFENVHSRPTLKEGAWNVAGAR